MMNLVLEDLQDAAQQGHTKLVSEVLVAVGQAVVDGQTVTISSSHYPQRLFRLNDFEQYMVWVQLHFSPVLRA